MNYQEAVSYLYDIPKFVGKTTQENTKNILKSLGSPEKGYKIFHVAGTNGKGSVCSYIDSILREGGYDVGLFTSPHLVKPNERIKINGMDVSDEDFVYAFNQVYNVVKDKSLNIVHPSFFEFIFIMALIIFKKRNIKLLVLEVGLGGRLDTTNIMEGQVVSVITSISLEHTEILGDTIEAIAGEKAGIIKKNVPVVFDGTTRDAIPVILKKAEENMSDTNLVDFSHIKIIKKDNKMIDFSLDTSYDVNVRFTINFPAEYQVINAALAVYSVDIARKKDNFFNKITDKNIFMGIKNMQWEGRMERVSCGQTAGNVYLDGAHNASGIAEFIKTVNSMENIGKKALLFGVVKEKRYSEMIKNLSQSIHWEYVYVTVMDTKRTVDTQEIKALFEKYGVRQVQTFDNAVEAFEAAIGKLGSEDALFVAGSLYLVGEIKSYLA